MLRTGTTFGRTSEICWLLGCILKYDTNARMRLWERKIRIEMEVLAKKMVFDEFLEACVKEAKEIIAP